MHNGLNITIALTIAESASWRAVGNPEIMAKVLVNAVTVEVSSRPPLCRTAPEFNSLGATASLLRAR